MKVHRKVTGIVSSTVSALILVALPGGLAAQERQVPLDSLEQVVEIGQDIGDLVSDLRISGFGVADFAYQSGTDNNTLAATKFAISVFKRAGAHFSFFGQLTTLFEFEGSGGAEDEEGAALETEIDNLIVSVTPPGAPELSLWFGRFDAPLGFERDDEPLNFQPTTSFNFEFARPVKFTGLLARYTPLPELSLSGFLVNGWDEELDNNNGKSFGARVSVLPQEFSAASVTAIYGPEKDDNTDEQRFLLTADFTVQPVRPLILGGEFNYGTEENSALDGGDADWIGGLVTGFVRLARNFGVTLRYDIFEDSDGSRTGQSQTLQSYTVAPMLFFRTAVTGIFSTIPQTNFQLPEFQLRAGFRYNKSNRPFFAADGGLDRDEFQIVAEAVYVF